MRTSSIPQSAPDRAVNTLSPQKSGAAKKVARGIAAIGIALLSYIFFMHDIRVSLWPHAQALRYLYGLEFVFLPGEGYAAQGAGFVITSGCMGAALFVSMFLLLALGFSPQSARFAKRVGHLAKSYAFSIAAAFAVSVLRMAVSLPFCALPNAQLTHNVISLVIYFGSMACLYVFMSRRRGGEK